MITTTRIITTTTSTSATISTSTTTSTKTTSSKTTTTTTACSSPVALTPAHFRCRWKIPRLLAPPPGRLPPQPVPPPPLPPPHPNVYSAQKPLPRARPPSPRICSIFIVIPIKACSSFREKSERPRVGEGESKSERGGGKTDLDRQTGTEMNQI